MSGTGLPGLNQYLARINVSCSRTQGSDDGEARTRRPSVSSQALYHWATVLSSYPVKYIFCPENVVSPFAGDKKSTRSLVITSEI